MTAFIVSSTNAKPTHHRNVTTASGEILKRIQANDKEIMLQTGFGEGARVLWTDQGCFTELGNSRIESLSSSLWKPIYDAIHTKVTSSGRG